jgi:hypothetical protein
MSWWCGGGCWFKKDANSAAMTYLMVTFSLLLLPWNPAP